MKKRRNKAKPKKRNLWLLAAALCLVAIWGTVGAADIGALSQRRENVQLVLWLGAFVFTAAKAWAQAR